jgi:DNA polymerase beta
MCSGLLREAQICLFRSRRECDELPEVSILLHHNHHVHVPIPPPPPSSTSLAAAPKTTPVDPRGRQLLPFHRAFTSAAHRRASPFLQDVVRPLQAAAILVATLFDSVHKWHGIALLPLRAANADPDTGGTLGHAWQEVGDRMRDIRATRGRYLRLDLR